MKRCPACDRTYADEAALNCCLDDGAPLLHVESGSSYDPQQTLRIPAAPTTEQRRTDVLPRTPSNPPPSYGPSPYTPVQPGGYAQATLGARRSNPWPWIIGISVPVLFGLIFVAGFVVYKMLQSPTVI